MADDKTLDLILREARSHAEFGDRPVPEAALRAAHDLMKWGPTTANSQPMRVLYLRSKEAREKLRPALAAVNVGHGTGQGMRARDPRFTFDEACRII